MGIWDNVKENVRDIGGGIGSVFRGKPTTDRERDITRKQKQFEELRKNPIPDTSGYTPVKDSYGRVTYSGGGGSSRGSSGGGGSGSNAQARAEAERKRQAEIARQEQIRKQQEEAQRLADQLKSEREQKAFGQTIGGQVEVSSVRNKYGQIGDTGKVKIGDHTYIGSSYIDE